MHYKQPVRLLLSALLFSVAFGSSDGFYTGITGNLNRGHYDASNGGLTSSSKIDDNNAGGRLFFGYQYNPYVAAEFGYANYGKSRFNDLNGSSQTGELKQHGFSLLANFSWPINRCMNIYAQAGAIRLVSKANQALDTQSTVFAGDVHHTHPLAGVGFKLDLSSHTSLALQYQRVFKRNEIQAIDSIGLRLAYHFG